MAIFDPSLIDAAKKYQFATKTAEKPATPLTNEPVQLVVPPTWPGFADLILGKNHYPGAVNHWSTDLTTLTAAEASDDFTGTDGDAPDPLKWEEYYTGSYLEGSISINSNRLRINKSGTATATTNAEAISRFKIGGNFSVGIDFSDQTLIGNSQYLRLYTGVKYDADDMVQVYENAAGTTIVREVDGGSQTDHYSAVGDLEGATVTVTRTGTSWVVKKGSTTLATFTGVETDVYIVLGGSITVTNDNIDVSFDNFTINSADGIEMLSDELGQLGGTINNMTPTVGGPFDNYLAGGDCASVARSIDFGTDVPFKAVSIWLKRNSLSDYEPILYNNTLDHHVSIRTSGDGNQIYGNDGTANNTNLTISEITDFHHIMIVEGSDDDTHWVWLDGVKASSEVGTGLGGVFDMIGRATANTAAYCPDYTNIQVFDFIPTDAQIAEIYDYENTIINKRIAILDDSDNQKPVEIELWEKGPEPVSHYTTDTTELTAAEASDDFTGTDGDAPDTHKWFTAEPGGSAITINSNKLRGVITSAAVVATCDSHFVISGDFDVQVDFDLITTTTTNAWVFSFELLKVGDETTRLYADRRYNSAQQYLTQVITGGATDDTDTNVTTDTSGKFRFTRSGSTVNVYTWNGSSWDLRSTYASWNTSDVSARIKFRTTTSQSVTCDFDNFTVNSADGIEMLVDEQEQLGGTITNMTPAVGGPFDNYLAGGDITSQFKHVDFGSTSFKSISFWIKRTQLINAAMIMRTATGAPNFGVRESAGSGYLFFYTTDYQNSNLVLSDTASWHHICIVEGTDNNTHWLYLDRIKGSAELTSNFAGTFRYFGRETTATQEVPHVTNIQVFDFKLTDEQIAMLYAAGKRGKPFSSDKTIHKYNAADVTGSTLPDGTGSVDGTITNMTKTAGGPVGCTHYLAGGTCDGTNIRAVDLGSGLPNKAVSLWFRRGDLTKYTCLLSVDPASNKNIAVRGSGLSDPNALYAYDGSSANISNLTVTDNTTWHHLVIAEGTTNNASWLWLDKVKASAELTHNFAGLVRGLGRIDSAATTLSTPDLANIQVFEYIPTDEQIAELYQYGFIKTTGNQYVANHAILHSVLPSTADTGLKLVYDETQVDNDVRSAADASDDFTGTDGDAPDPFKWSNNQGRVNFWSTAFNGTADIQSNALSLVPDTGSDTAGLISLFKFSGAFEFEIDLVKQTDASFLLDIIDDGDNRIYLQQSAGAVVTKLRQSIAGSWDTTTDGSADSNTCSIKVSRAASNVISFYVDDVLLGTRTLSADVLIRFRSALDDSIVDNFTINSADAITGFVGDTGSLQAQAVWPSAYKARWGMSQSPIAADSVLDSTANDITLSPTNMGAGNLVDQPIGRGLELNGTDEYLTTASESVLDITDELTLVAKVTPGSLWSSAMSNNKVVVDRQGSGGNDSYQMFVSSSEGKLNLGTSGGNIRSTKVSWTADNAFVTVVTYKATGLVGTMYIDGATETLSSDSYDAMAGATTTLRIGALAGTAVNFADMVISEARIINDVLSADQAALQHASLTDALFDFALPESAIIRYWDQLYGDPPNTEHLLYWDQSYALLNYIIGYFDHVYGIQLQRYWDHTYGNNPLVKVFWDLLYGDQQQIKRFWDLEYGDRVELIRYWDQKYNIRTAIQQFWDHKYGIMGKEILKHWDQPYDVKNTNPLMKWFDQYYHIIADSVVESAALGFYIDGVRYEGPYHVSWELNVDSYKNTGEMHFNYPAPFFAAGEGKEMRIVDTDIDLKLEITIPTKSERTNETLYFIKGESKSRILERAEVFTETFRNTTAATICTTIAARYGITIDWQIPDWPLSEYDVNDQTPLQAIRGLTGDDCAKACLQTDFDGDTVSVMKRMESDSHMWDTDTPSYYITDSLHLEQTNQRGEYKKGYNAYRVTDQSSASETRTWIEDEEYADAKREVHVFRVPWDGTARLLYTSDNNATIQYLGIVTEDLEEEFSIVNGEGEGKTKNPAYAVVSWSYNDTDLGTPTVTEEGVVQTATEGTSMLMLTYTTRYYKWIVTDYDDPKIQIWVE